MEDPHDLGQFADNMKELATDYYKLQKRIARLTLIRYLAKAGGAVMDGVIRFVLLAVVGIFAAVTGALWLTKLTGSYISGFGYMTLIILVLSILIHLLRKPLFVNPIVHRLVRKLHADTELSNTGTNEEDTPHK